MTRATARQALALAILSIVLAGGCSRESEPPPRGPATPLDPSTTGTIRGTVRFEGEPPKATPLRMSGDAACPAGTHAIDALVHDGLVENVFVYVREGLGDRVFERPKEAVVIDQQGCLYRPHVLGVQTGQELRFLNSDPTLHNVHVVTEKSRGANFGMGVKGAKRSIRLDSAEVMVTVKCDVHPWMRAYVGVLDHPYFAVTGRDGAFRLENVPAGEYVLEAWHERFGRQTATVKVAAGETDEARFEFGS